MAACRANQFCDFDRCFARRAAVRCLVLDQAAVEYCPAGSNDVNHQRCGGRGPDSYEIFITSPSRPPRKHMRVVAPQRGNSAGARMLGLAHEPFSEMRPWSS